MNKIMKLITVWRLFLKAFKVEADTTDDDRVFQL